MKEEVKILLKLAALVLFIQELWMDMAQVLTF